MFRYIFKKRELDCVSIEDVVALLNHLVDKKESLEDSIVRYLQKIEISENALQHISTLHKMYGKDLGVNGFAINVLWSCMLYSQQDKIPQSK